MPAQRRYRFSRLWDSCAVEAESRGVVSVVVGEGLTCFREARRRLSVKRVDWEDSIVDAWMLRWALRAETETVRKVVEGRARVFTLFVKGGDLIV
jgi:hypothetical protein